MAAVSALVCDVLAVDALLLLRDVTSVLQLSDDACALFADPCHLAAVDVELRPEVVVIDVEST